MARWVLCGTISAISVTCLGAGVLAQTPSAESHPASETGPAEHVGREVDAAVATFKRWLSARTDQASAATRNATAEARIWFDARVVNVLGDPAAPRAHGVFIARAIDPATGVAPTVSSNVQPQWITIDALKAAKLPERVVVLVHGLDEPGAVWDDLAPALLEKGYAVAKFEYPNDGGIADSAKLFSESLMQMKSMGVRQVDIVAHSMGGLVVRDALTRPDVYAGNAAGSASLPSVGRFIMLATPNHGSKLAPLQPLSEAREQLARCIDGTRLKGSGLINSSADGAGEAGRDLEPGSEFLAALNARPIPRNVRITNVVARVIPEERERQFAADIARLAAMIDERPSPTIDSAIRSFTANVGDGLLNVEGMKLEGVENVTVVADHRSVVRKWHMLEGFGIDDPTPHELPTGVRVVLDVLEADRAPAP